MMLSRLLTTSLIRTCFAALTALTVCAGTAHSEPVANQLPSGGAVVAGSAAISQSGTAQAPVMTVQQNSDRAIVNWNNFNIGRDASVVFKQPDTNSAILNRVLDGNPSQIFGNLQSNGQVFLMNPSGVWFGKDASVDVGALFATTHSISNDRFMSGVMRFERNGATGAILNAGSIATKLGGYIALLAPEVRNDGILLAQSGSIMLAAGEAATLNFDPANSRVDLLVEPSRVNALIENRKLVKAPDGKVVVSAQAYNDIASGVIKNSGEIVATGIQSIGGKIVLGASTEVTSTGTLDASSRVANAGSVRINADNVNNAGVINASSEASTGKGGEVIITGREIALNDGSQINANGTTGGGKVLVGGDWQGSGDLRQATKVTMSDRATIDASAIQSGDGGKVVLWSDIHNPDSLTIATGTINAKAGINGGDGGKIETSGYALNVDGIKINAGSTKGKAGLWLIDPFNYNIYSSNASAIGNALNSTSVTVTTATQNTSYGSSTNSADLGDITLHSNIAKTATSGTTTLTLQANRRINLQSFGISSAAGGPLNVVLWTDSDRTNDAGIGTFGSITTNGGHLWVGGGSASTTWNGLTVPNGPAVSHQNANWNPLGLSDRITTAGGDVMLWSGIGYGGTGPSNNLFATGSGAINAGSGNITLRARSFDWAVTNRAYGGFASLELTSTGLIRILPDTDAGSFGLAVDSRWFDLTRATPGGFEFGHANNTSALIVGAAITTTGPIALNVGSLNLASNLATTNTSTGDISIKASSISGTGNISLANTRGLSFDLSSSNVYAGLISGTNATLTKLGAGTLSLTNANTYSGGTTLNAGRLGIYNSGSVGSGTLTAANGTSLLFGRAVSTFANNLVFNGNVTIDLDTSVDYLIVGGGGGGGAWVGGGGGGGGVLAGTTDLTDSSYAVSVGGGGVGLIYDAQAVRREATSGGNSSAFGLTAIGGGHGGTWTARVAASGGSGGGQGHSQAAAAGTAGQGFAGGTGNGASTYGYVTGGGGGAGGAGGNWTPTRSGAGGIGLASSITGTLNYYGGGGGGGVHGGGSSDALPGLGGLGGGANGSANTNIAAASGVANTGGGGGGSGRADISYSHGGNGGSGIVVVRYLGGTAGTGGNPTSGSGDASGYTLHSFTNTGSSTLTLNPVALTLSGTISGSGGPTVDATAGTIKFTGNSSYTGATSITGGVVQTSNANALGNNSAVSISNLATTRLEALSSLTLGSLAGGGTTGGNVVLSTGANLTVGGNNTSTTYAGVISGAASLTKNGAGTFTLTGTNTYSGTTTISAGGIQIGTGSTLGAISNGDILLSGMLIFNRSDNVLLNNLISGAGSLTKLGAGRLSLTAANAYSGGTTLSAGSLGVYANTALGSGTVTAAGNNSVLLGRSVTSVANNFVLNGGVTFDLDTSIEYLIIAGGGGGGGGIAGGGGAGEFITGGIQLDGSSYSLTVGNGGLGGINANGASGGASSAFGISAAGGGGGGNGFGSLALNGGSGGGGGATNTNGAGISVKTGGGFGFNGGNGSLNGTGGNLAVAGGGGGAGGAGASTAVNAQSGGNGGAGRASDITGTSVLYAGGGGGGINGVPGWSVGPPGIGQAGGGNGGVIASTGVGRSGFAATANSGSGGGGASNAEKGGDGGSGVVIVRYLGGTASSGGTLSAGTGSAAGYTVQRFTTTGSNTLTMNPIAVTLGGTISGTGAPTVDATAGTIKFTGHSSYSGATSITGGVVQTEHVNALGNNSAVTISNVAGTRLEALSSLTIGSLAGGGTTGGNVVLSSGATLSTGANNTSPTYSGVISGGGSLVKQGSGTLIFANDQTYTGSTTISNGTLQLGDGGSTGGVAGDIINNGTLALRFGADKTLSNNISGSGNLTLTGVSNTLFSQNLTTTAQTIATNTTVAEVLYRLSGGRLSGVAMTSNVSPREGGIHTKLFDPLTNTATFQIQQYDSRFTKGLFVRLTQSGSNVQAAINTSAPHTNGTVYTESNIVGSDLSSGYTYGMPLATCYACDGYGVDRLDLSSKITLTGNLSYTGTTTLNNTTTTVTTGINQYTRTALGTLQWNGDVPSAGNITNNGVLILNGSNAQTSALVVAGTGTLIKNGSNTLTLSGAQTYTGDTVVNAGGLTIGSGGTTGSVTSSTNLFLPFASATMTLNRSDDQTLSNAIRGVGTFRKAGNNNVTLTNSSLAAAFGIAGGKLIIQNNTPPVSGNSFSGAGSLEIISAGTTFSSAFSTSGITFGSDLGGLTIGRSTNTVGITLASATNITGPISVTGSSVAVNANLSTSGANNGISLKATGGITQAASTTTQTNGGDVTYWSNSSVDTMTSTAVGGVHLFDNATLDSRRTVDRNANNLSTATGGGTITLGGGSATTTTTLGTTVPSGYALNLASTSSGIILGTNTLVGHVSGIRILSGGGNISLSGRSTQNVGSSTIGLQPYEGLTVNAGTNGNLRMRGIAAGATGSAGIDFQTYRAGTTSASATTLQTAGTGSIEIYGLSTTTGSGIQGGVLNANAGLTIAATGSGSLTLTGISAAGGTADLALQGMDLLAASGTITLNGGRSGAVLLSNAAATTIGFRSGSLVTGSTSNIVTNFDTYSMSSGVTLNTTGTVAIQSFSDSFASALSWPTTNLTLGANVSGLRIGKSSNQSNVTIASATTIAGPVTVFGGDINVNGAINTSGGAANNRNILLQASGTITQAANVAVTTGGGNVIYRANSDGQTSNGSIFLRDGSSISTGGGHLWLGGGSVDTTWNGLTVGDGFAVSGTSVQPVCASACGMITAGIFLEAASLSSGGGQIGLRGRATGAGHGIASIGGVLLNGGSGKVRLDGDADSGTGIVAGVHYMFRTSLLNVQSTNTATDAIVVSGTANSGIGILTGPTRLEATNGGGISLSGTTTTGSIGTYFGYLNYVATFAALANTGPITINGGASMLVEPSTTITLGQQASSSVTSSSSNIELIANAMTFRASDSIASSGSLTLRPATNNTTIGIAGGAGTLSLPATLFNNGTGVFKNGFSQITIGSATAGNVTFGGGLAFADNTTVRSGGNITLNSGTAITNTQAGGQMVLAAGGNFINNAGANAVATTDAGTTDRWIIYSANSANTTFGTPVLASGNSALWGSTFSSLAPADVASGNRYVFGNSPLVTVSTTNATKTYGDTANLSNQLSLSIPSLVSGAFTQPSAADVFSSLPTVTSSGAAASASVSGGPYAITASGGVPRSGLSVTYSNVGQLTVLPRALTLTGTTTYGKVYDGTNSASLTGALSGVLFNDAVGVNLSATFATANAGNGIAVTSTSTLTGAAAANYSLTQPAGLTANITKKSLTVTANNDAKFAGRADTAGYYGVSYNGFVSGESASALTTAPIITRSNAVSNIAGTYTGVLVPSGAVSGNYAFSYVNGDYTIVPADQMLVRLAPVSNTYGTAPTLTVSEAKYMSSNGGTLVDLLAFQPATVTGNQIVVRESANVSATFTVSAVNGTTSGAGWLKAGSYQLAATNISTTNGVNFSNTVTLIGNQQVAPIALTPAPTISKEYDGSVAIAAFSTAAAGRLAGDTVLLNGSGTFANKNAGSNKTYTLSGLNLSGADAANYSLSSGSTLTAANGTITQRALSISGIAANDKTYDGSTSATLNYAGVQFGGLVAGDVFSVAATGTFASANAGVRSVSLSNPVYTGADVSNYLVTPQTSTSATITPKSLTLTGLVAANKVYDGTTAASISNFGSLTGVVGSDAVSLVSSQASASFANKLVGTGKTVTVLASSLSLSGAAAANYAVTVDPTTTANISAKSITVSGITAANKTYDGTTSASVNVGAAVFNGMVSGDALSVSASGSFGNKNAGTNKTVSLISSYSGADLSNYSITDQASATATISAKALTVSGLVADSRVYDGTTATTVNNSNVMLSGLLVGDVVNVTATGTFANKNVGTNKVVTLSSSYTGADVANYTIADQASSSANITPKALTISGITASNKTYDGTNSATVNSSAPTRTGLVAGDVVTVAATGTFSDENVANTKTVTLVSSYSGADSGNYSITDQTTTTANITPLDVNLAGATGVTKTYDTSASLPAGVSGYGALSSASASVLATDLAINGGLGLTGAPVFDSANAGNRVVQQGSVMLGGSRAGNYRLVWANGSGEITQAPLTITANDDAKFYSEADTAGYAGVRYAGFVGGQTASTAGVFGGTLAITRDRTSLTGSDTQDSAGTYSSALIPSGLTSSNYAINFAAGHYTIVPVGELLVKLQNITTTYGNTPNFVVSSAGYMSDNLMVTNLLGLRYVSVSGNTVTITDGSDPKASFDVAAVNGTLSSAGHLKAGSYALGASVIYNTSSDFTNTINIVGAWQVNQKGVTVNPTGVTKVYDGSAVMSNLALAPNGLVTPTVNGSLDQVSITGNGNFIDKHVTAQANKAYTLSGLTLTGVTSFGSTVDDSSNYFLTNGATYVGNDGQITPRTLNVTYGGINKVYDGFTSAVVTTTDDRVVGDALGITRTAEFGNKNVGNGKNVYVTGVSLTGADADNYVVNATSNTTADITPRTLVVGYGGINKIYDGTLAATVTTSDDRVAGDDVTIARTAVFADKNVGGAKTVSVSGVTLSGTDAANYSVTSTGTTTANITQRSLTLSYSGNNKVYDGGTVATVVVTDDRVAGDTLTINRTAEFADKNFGTGKAVSVSGVSLSGTDADNYSVFTTGATTADITPKTLSVTYGGINKVYDGTTATSVTSSDDRVSGDVLDVIRTAVFSDKNAATGKTVNVSGVSLSGTDAINYTVAATGTTTADITPRTLVVTYTGDNKVYDGGTVATVATSDDRVAGDVLSVVRSASFADKNVGSAKAVSVSAVSLTGTDATNYSVASTGTTTADITPRTLNVTYAGVNKVYDGLLTASVTTDDDRVNGDVVTISRTASFADKNVANGKPVSVFGVGLGGADALNYTVAALGNTTANITPRALTPTFGGISKIYDGSTTAQVTSSDDRLVNDVFSIVRTGNFDDRHVGSGKTVTINGLSLTGADAINYALTLSSATVTARIDQAASTSWIGGGATADWMDAGNWAGGVLPDRANVAAVTFNETAIVSFGASAGTVSLTSLQAPNMSLTQTGGSLATSGAMTVGALRQSAGTLSTSGAMTVGEIWQSAGTLSTSGAMTVGELWQSAGTLSVGELLTVNSGFSQTGSGSITTSYGAVINNGVGDLTIGNLTSNGPIELTNNDGGVSQIANTVLIAREGLVVTARTGDTPRPIDLSNAGNQISGSVSLSGSSTALRSTGPVSAILTGSDGGTLQTDGTLSVSGTLTGNSSHLTLISPDVQLGGLSIGGNLGVTGPTTVGGALDIGGSIDINGAAVLVASVTSGGAQRWRSTVDITSNVGITGDGLRFESDLNGPHRLVLTDSGNTLIVGAIGNTDAPLHFETNGAGTTTLSSGLVRTSGSASLVFNTDVVVTADTVFDSTNNGALPGGAAITFARTLNGTSANTESVVLNAGTSGIVTTGAIGNSVPLKTLTLVNSGGATFGAVTTGTSAVIDATANGQWVNFAGNLLTPELSTRAGAYHLSMTGASNSVNSATTFLNTGRLVIGDAANDQSSFVGGLVATAPSAITLGGTISTSNAVINLGDANTPLTLQAATVLSSSGGPVVLGGSVDSDATTPRALTVNTGSGDLVFTGAVGDTNSLGAIAINSAGETRFEAAVDAASLTTDAAGTLVLDGGSITTSGNITLSDAITLGAQTTLAGQAVTLTSTVNGARSLTINASGATTFGSAIGSSTALTSLTTDAAGTLILNGGAITATGNITLNDAITLGAPTTLAGQGVTLASTVNGAHALTINASGATTFGVAIGGTTALTSLTTDSAGTLVLNGGSITTSGNITLNDAITLGAPTTLAGQAVTLTSTINGAHALTINASGATTFGGAVGGTTALTSVTTDAAGTLSLNGGSINTSGNQSYGEAMTLGADTTLTTTNANITFNSTVDSDNTAARSLTIDSGNGNVRFMQAAGTTNTNQALGDVVVNTTGDTRFDAAVKAASVTTNAGGTLSLNGGSVTTSGSQSYGEAVTLGADTTLTATNIDPSVNTNITFNSMIDSDGTPRQLMIDSGNGTTSLGGEVGISAPLTALTINSGSLTVNDISVSGNVAIVTGGGVEFSDLTVGGDLSVTTGKAGVSGGVSQAANSALRITGTSNFIAHTKAAQDAALNSSTNDFVGSVAFTNANGGNWRDVGIVDAQGGVILADIAATGNLTVQSDRGPITQAANAALSIGGISSFIASANGPNSGAADILLGNANNNFSGVVNLDGAHVTVRDSNALQLGQVNAAGNIDVRAAGNVDVSTASVAGTMIINTGSGNLSLGQTLVAGDTTITTGGGAINQTGRLSLLGDVLLDAGAGVITLTNPANNFGGELTLNAGSTSLATSADLTLGSVYNRGDLALITRGNLNLGSATTVQGNLTLSSGGTLDLGTADVDGDLNVSTAGGPINIGSANVNGNMSVASSGGNVVLGTMQIAGNLAASTSGGNLSQTAAMDLDGSATINLGTGQLNLSNAQNDFSGAVSITAASATIRDANALALGTLAISGLLDANARNDLTLGSGSVGTVVAESQTASIVQQAAGLTVSGAVELVAADRIQLDSANNRFGPVSAEAAWVNLNAASALQIDRLLASQSAVLSSDAVLTLGAVNVAGELEAAGAAGIVQVAALNIGGAASFESSNGDVVLDAANNVFAGPVALAGNVVNVRAASALQLGDVQARGDLKLETTGGPITQAVDTKLVAQADINFKARNNGAAAAIELGNAKNDFVGIVTADGAAIKLEDAVGKLKLGTINATGMLEAKAKGGSIVLEPGKLQMALGGMILTPDPRPSVVPMAQARVESMSGMGGNANVSAKASTASTGGSSSITLSATSQNVGTSDGVIKVSSAPLVQANRQVIPVGQVIALDTTSADVSNLSAASFEIVDGLAPGATIEIAQSSVTAKVDNQTGKVVMSGDASVSDYDKAIQGIKLRVGDDAPTNAVIKIKITLTDGKGNVETRTVTVQVGESEKISKNP